VTYTEFGPLFVKNTFGMVMQYSGNLLGIAAQDVATLRRTRRADASCSPIRSRFFSGKDQLYSSRIAGRDTFL
jgi:hypothetical protein